MNEHIKRFRKFLDSSQAELKQIAELLEQADQSRSDELMNQLNAAERSHTELQKQLHELDTKEDTAADALRSAYDAATGKLESLINSLKQQLDRPV